MTEENQNIDRHYLTVNATTNRISGNHLSTDSNVPGIKQMENGKIRISHRTESTESKLHHVGPENSG
jgi:hypothetical protein